MSRHYGKDHLLNHMYKFHYPPLGMIVGEMNTLTVNARNPLYQAATLRVERALYLSKILQVLMQHRQGERFIVPQCRSNMVYCLKELHKITNDRIRGLINSVLPLVDAGCVGFDEELVRVLPEILKLEYPHAHELLPPHDPTSPLSWCLSHMVGVTKTFKGEVKEMIDTFHDLSVPSFQYLASLVKKFFLVEEVIYEDYQDTQFNVFLNLCFFWTTVIKMYQSCIFKDKLLDTIKACIELLKGEARQFFGWYDLNTPNLGSSALVKYTEHLIRALSVDSSAIPIGEICSHLHHCKHALLNLE
ncbi:unknown [Macaca mulatta rhadinovirus 17577]|uniref:ORF49 n=2 Tax=Macacine gammaherpesvirus 5 TaxID=154334 RepID=Q77NJ0_9GAMA|nr:hypothetical protein MmrVgp49 [Macacine gammaherpesvirus 5]AAD21376.1 unknown [Macaca mulatta rhadinovirus 17577]AAF60028.1 ORF49 [Rhesus monkey rhadinovirus H26-95]WUF06342.1 hypothetical protein [synthetic construct]WVG99650.1 unknown [Macaca mulatta rhadinovirus]QFN51664.1 ORF 49 [Macacine gammaherpesvirus 5]